MTDFSIKKTTTTSGVTSSSSKNSEYDKLKKEYDLFVRKTSKSDFANSQTTLQTRKELLAKLKELAKTDALSEETEWIENEEKLIQAASEPFESDLLPSVPFYKPISRLTEDVPMDVESVLEACKDSNGKFDQATVKLVMAFKNATQKDEYFIPYIVKKCRDLDGSIPDKTVEAIEALITSGVEAPFLSRTIDSFLAADNSEESINLNLCEKMLKAKSLGFDDMTALKLSRILSSGYTNEDEVLNSVKKLSSANISDDVIFDIIKAITVVNETGEKSINTKTVDSVVLLKNTLRKTQINEKNERLNPISINNQPIQVSNEGDIALYMKKDGTFQTVYLEQYDSVQEAKKAYDDIISKTEDNMLLEFIRKYKNSDGTIDNKYLRIITALRSFGITYESLFDLTDLCVDESGSIDKNSLNAVNLLKTNGAISNDIPDVLSSITKNSDGTYNPEELETACDLSSAAIGQPYLTELFADAKSNINARHFIITASPYFDKKSDLIELIKLIKSDGQNIDDVALEIADDILFSDNNDKTETNILSFLSELLKVSKGTEQTVSSDAEKVCCSIDYFTPDEVLSLVKLCLDSNGNVDGKLADAVYKLYHEGFGFNVIIEKINACKNGTSIDYDKIENMI